MRPLLKSGTTPTVKKYELNVIAYIAANTPIAYTWFGESFVIVSESNLPFFPLLNYRRRIIIYVNVIKQTVNSELLMHFSHAY